MCIRDRRGFGQLAIVRCGRESAEVEVGKACAVGAAKDGADIEEAAHVVELSLIHISEPTRPY